jgi:V8-like Glu-specific endopeptidase
MFERASAEIRNTLYGVIGRADNVNDCTIGTGFMIAEGIVVTAAHLVYPGGDFSRNRLMSFSAIQVSDDGITSEKEAQLLQDDADRDIALLLLNTPPSKACVTFKTDLVNRGTLCGCLGFPHARFLEIEQFWICERFQQANISAIYSWAHSGGRAYRYYEIDRFVYPGASGSPVFLPSAEVVGMVIKGFEAEANVDNVELGQQVPVALYPLSLVVPSTDIISFAIDVKKKILTFARQPLC